MNNSSISLGDSVRDHHTIVSHLLGQPVNHTEKLYNEVENTLSKLSVYPVIGTVAGVGKILMGLIQTIKFLAINIFLFIASCIISCYSRSNIHAGADWTHVKHGLGNVIAGIFESIPIVQSLFFALRKLKAYRLNEIEREMYVGQEMKFMYYSKLVRNPSYTNIEAKCTIIEAKCTIVESLGYIEKSAKFCYPNYN